MLYYEQEVCFECKGSLNSAEKVVCSRNDCDRVYHFSCTVDLSDVSWSCEGKLVCPQHVSDFEGFSLAAIVSI